MSKCKINITIGTGRYVVEVDSTALPSSMEELQSLLKNNDSWKDMKAKIKESLLKRDVIEPVKLSELESQSKVIPNTTTKVLRDKYPNFRFPDGVDNIPILFVNKYETLKDGNMWGRYEDKNGNEVFIIDTQHVKMFADYLSIRKMVNEGAIDQYPEIKAKLDKIVAGKYTIQNGRKGSITINNIKDLIVQFIHNRNAFRESTITIDGQSLSSILDKTCLEIFEKFGFFRKSYTNNLVNNIAHSIIIQNNKLKLNKNLLHTLLSNEGIIKFDSDKAFREFFNQSLEDIQKALEAGDIKQYKISNQKTLQTLREIFSSGIIGENAWEILTKYIINLDKSFSVSYVSNNNTDIILDSFVNFKSLGIYMPDFKNMEIPVYYHGQYITKRFIGTDKVEFYVTSNYPLSTSRVKYFPSEREAKQFIDSKNRIVSNTSRINLHYTELDDSGNFITEDSYRRKVKDIGKVTEGSVLTVLDYNLKKPLISNVEDAYFISGQASMEELEDYLFKLKDEKDFLLFLSDERESIVKTLNTPEKIAIFISEIAGLRNTDGRINRENKTKLLDEILPKLDDDNNLQYKYYYVYKASNTSAVLIPFDNVTTLKEYQQEDETIPVSRLWRAVSSNLSPLLGTELHILTAADMESQFEQYSDKKAFIKDGQIYINSSLASTSDLLHEYAHIALAYLKNNLEYRETYKGLLESIWNIASQKEKNQIITTYKNSSQEDIMEELFVKKFGDWIEDQDFALDSVFRNNESLKKATKIFDANDKSIKDVFGTTLKSVFMSFNNGISALLTENPSLMNEQFQEQFTLSRKQSDWIQKRKENDELEEVCK